MGKTKIKLSKDALESFALDELLDKVKARKKLRKKQKALNKKEK